MNRVRKQVGCSDRIQNDIVSDNISVAILDTGERVIILSG